MKNRKIEYLGYFIGSILLFFSLFYFFNKRSDLSSSEKIQLDQLMIIFTDPLDCQLNLKGKKKGELISMIRECSLKNRNYDSLNDQFNCTQGEQSNAINLIVPSFSVKVENVDVKMQKIELLLMKKGSQWQRRIYIDGKVAESAEIENCQPRSSMIIEERKSKLETYPGAGAINL